MRARKVAPAISSTIVSLTLKLVKSLFLRPVTSLKQLSKTHCNLVTSETIHPINILLYRFWRIFSPL